MFDKEFLDFILVAVYFRSGLLDDELLSRKKSGLFAGSSMTSSRMPFLLLLFSVSACFSSSVTFTNSLN